MPYRCIASCHNGLGSVLSSSLSVYWSRLLLDFETLHKLNYKLQQKEKTCRKVLNLSYVYHVITLIKLLFLSSFQLNKVIFELHSQNELVSHNAAIVIANVNLAGPPFSLLKVCLFV